jgi:hypothetical protein
MKAKVAHSLKTKSSVDYFLYEVRAHWEAAIEVYQDAHTAFVNFMNDPRAVKRAITYLALLNMAIMMMMIIRR